ncbi:MAG: hypothetical protein ABJF23_09900 [Bryobacteraceae bacterium]
MATARQIEANRQNAAGPHKMTEAGRQAIRGNAIRHGLAARVHVVLPGEDQGLFDEILASLRNEYSPSTTQEELLVHQIAENYWRLLRGRNMESGAFLEVEADFAQQYGVESNPAYDVTRGAQLALAFSKNGDIFDKLNRYAATAERSCYRAIRELQKIQQGPARKTSPVPQQDAVPGMQAIAAEIQPTAPPSTEFRSVLKNQPNPTHRDMERAAMRMSDAEFTSFIDEVTAPPSLNSR